MLGLALHAGGYYATAWAPALLGCTLVAAAALIATAQLPLARAEWITVASSLAWLALVAAECARRGAATAGVPVFERDLLYATVLWTALLVLRRATIAATLASLLAALAAIALVGLHQYLAPGPVPDYFEGRLLEAPVGYANAAGILAAVGTLLALSFAAHAPTRTARAASAAALVPLASAVAFTESRGALLALAAAGSALLALDSDRTRLVRAAVVTLPFPLVVVAVAARTHLGDARAAAPAVAHDGRAVGALLLAATAAAGCAAAATLRDTYARPRLRIRRSVALLGTAAALAVVAAVGARSGLALGDRYAYWSAAWRDVAAHPWLGSGPGSFAAAWLRYRDVRRTTLDAHNLYLQTLAELGPLGLALLVCSFAVPLAAAVRARRRPWVAGAAAAYVALIVHSALDWDWQMPAVATVELVLAATLLVAARPEPRTVRCSGAAVTTAAAVTALVAAAASAMLIANRALSSSEHAAASGDWPRAAASARLASRLQPWSSTPLLILAEADAARGDTRSARRVFLAAARRDPASWRAWYDVAVAFTGDERRAALERLRALDPLDAAAAQDAR